MNDDSHQPSRPVAGGGAGGGLIPPQNFWKLKSNAPKNI